MNRMRLNPIVAYMSASSPTLAPTWITPRGSMWYWLNRAGISSMGHLAKRGFIFLLLLREGFEGRFLAEEFLRQHGQVLAVGEGQAVVLGAQGGVAEGRRDAGGGDAG